MVDSLRHFKADSPLVNVRARVVDPPGLWKLYPILYRGGQRQVLSRTQFGI